jgi:hypothetical protein
VTRARILKTAKLTTAETPSAPPSGLALPWLEDSPAPRHARRTMGRPVWLRPAVWKLPSIDPILAEARSIAARMARKVRSLTPDIVLGADSLHVAQRLGRSDRPAMGLRKRIAVLLAIVTVPAMAAPGEFSLFSAPAPAPLATDPLALAAARALPFERPGMSFPGSAFYFLDDPPEDALIALPTVDPLDSGAEAGRELGEFIRSGPAAKPFFLAGGGVSHSRALECLAQAVWYEAASESEAGQRAVAQVVLNRVAHPNWPASVCGVVYQGSDRTTGCQFTFTCDGSLARRAGGASWARAQRIAAEALAGEVYAPVGHATHYHTLWVDPYWARSLDHVGTIGAHRFYRNRGAGGEKAAFTLAYAGLEPSVSGRMTIPETALPPAASFANADRRGGDAGAGRAAGRGSGKANGGAANKGKNAAPDTGNSEFAGSGEILPEFANAGKWKADPALIN